MLIQKIKITEIMPCLADPEKIRFIAYFDTDVSAVLPYLNAVLKGAIYNHCGKTLTLRKEGRLISLHPNRITAGKVLDEKDAAEIIEWIQDRINECWSNRAEIAPNFDRRSKLGALDIFKLLPGTNCRKCGELTCLAFAVRLSGENVGVMECRELFLGANTEKRMELLSLLKASGYEVPSLFVSRSS